MGEAAKWLLGLSGADLAYGMAAAIAAAVLVIALTLHLRQQRNCDDDRVDSAERKEREQLLLYCGDVKALTDLAIQRHFSDVAFLHRFQAQSCYEILVPHFSGALQERLAQPGRHDGRADLASACREECERLERLWQGA